MVSNILQHKGLLGQFIRQKLDAYKEPEKIGVPRDEQKGFSMKKYTALLFTMSTLKKKDIAAELDLPYGVLRNWNLEKDFDALRQSHCREFSELIYGEVKQKVANYLEEIKACDNLPPEEIEDYEPSLEKWKNTNPGKYIGKHFEMWMQRESKRTPKLNLDEFCDCEFYGECITDELWARLIKHHAALEKSFKVQNYDTSDSSIIIMDVMTQLILFPLDLESLSGAYEGGEELPILIKNSLAKKAKRLLSRNYLTAKDRKSLVFIISVLTA